MHLRYKMNYMLIILLSLFLFTSQYFGHHSVRCINSRALPNNVKGKAHEVVKIDGLNVWRHQLTKVNPIVVALCCLSFKT